MSGPDAATWGIAGLATFGVIARPWNLPECIWAITGAALLVAFDLLPWRDAMTAAATRKSNRSDPICFSPYLYRARNRVERFFNRIKQCRRIAAYR